MKILLFLAEVIIRTPLFVWVILALLIIRGINASRDNVLSVRRMLIFPAVFVVWGLETVVKEFTYQWEALLSYVVLAALGAAAGFVLYSRFRSFYQKDGAVWRTGTNVTMVIMMVNFMAKYVLNVAMAINPGFYTSLDFNIFYSMTSGLSLGLSVGGVIQAYKAIGKDGHKWMIG